MVYIISETECCRKAVKATSVLFPLLGTINLLFMFQPPNDSAAVMTYRVANAALQSSQVSRPTTPAEFFVSVYSDHLSA